MKFLEKDLENIIYETDNETLNDRGLFVFGKKIRQLNIGNYGIADIVTYKRPKLKSKGLITVYELKKEKIGISAFLQALNYVKGIDRYLRSRNHPIAYYDYKIILVGKDLDTSGSFCFLPDFFYRGRLTVEFYTYNFDIDGLFFDEQNQYHLQNDGF